MRAFVITTVCFGISSAACGDGLDDPKTVDCPDERGPFELGEGRVTGTLEFDAIEKPLSRGDVLTVRGTAFHEDGLAIREVRVAGVAATKDEFNFKTFTAEIPYQKIASSSPLTAQGQVTFQAFAVDACGNRYPFAAATVDVDPTPSVAVDELELTVEYPAQKTFLPADGSTPALVKIRGAGRAVGAVVRVEASAGNLKNVDESGDVVLSAPSGTIDQGTATVLFYGTEPGTVTITALVENKLASALIEVSGPPELSPERADLVPGMALDVVVSGVAEDEIRCRASENADISALVDGTTALDAEPQLIAPGDDGDRLLTVETAESPEGAGGTVVVTCEDGFGQVGTGRYTLSLDGFDPGGGGDEEPPPEDP